MAEVPVSGDLLERIQRLSPKRLALLATELERRRAEQAEFRSEPIAVIGIGCRFPGGVSHPDDFWQLLREGRDAIEEVPEDRWDREAIYDRRSGTPGKTNSRWGGFLQEIDRFDAEFFGISPAEAAGMDPQQRLLLEVSWQALEDAGVRGDRLDGSQTGVFFGLSTSDYASLLGRCQEEVFNVYSGSGVARSVAAGRLSYFLGLKGPNLAVDTACSSSAVAVHLACQSLRQRECRLALAGGVNALLTPQVTIALSQAHMLAANGRCKTFSAAADGFVRAEGCGVLVLKRLGDAQADGDRILGIVRSSAMNHDGRSSGLTAPNGPSQAAVVAAALEQAGVGPENVQYVETHGTGTVLGDAVELRALGSVFAPGREPSSPLIIGSVKSNVGHLEAAAGVASLIKVLLSFQHGLVPASLHVPEGGENEALRNQPLEVPRVACAWPGAGRRIAGVSSFGFSGTNVHLVLESAPVSAVEEEERAGPELFTLSARSVQALEDLCVRHAAYLRAHSQISLRDLAFTLNAGRGHFQHRVAFLADSVGEAVRQLEEIVRGSLTAHRGYAAVAGFQEPRIAFLFTGQGSQYPGMGRALYQASEVFRGTVDRCDAVLADKLPCKLADLLCRDASPVPIEETRWTQPALFAFEYALAMLWRSWGIRPSAVLGHSLGEYVAACVAGVFSFEDGLRLTTERGRLMATLPRNGEMLAVRGGEAEIAAMLAPYPGLSIAAVNGPGSVVVSGEATEMAQLRMELGARNMGSPPLAVSHAFHSALMNPIVEPFYREAERLGYAEPEIPLASNVKGRLWRPGERPGAEYWSEHIRATVRFSDGLSAVLEAKPVALVEIGPDPVLLGMAKPALAGSTVACLPSQRRGAEVWTPLYEVLGQMYRLGAPIDWAQVYRDRRAHKLSLPTYPFQRQRYWLPEAAAQASLRRVVSPPAAPRPEGLLYGTEWRSDPTQDHEPSATLSGSLDRARAVFDRAQQDAASRDTLEAYSGLLPALDQLSTAYILDAFRQCGLVLEKGGLLTHAQLRGLTNGSFAMDRLLHRLVQILAEEEILAAGPEGWRVLAVPALDTSALHKHALLRFPQFSAELAFLRRATEMADVLRGKVSGVEVLFPGGSLALAEQVYQESAAARVFNRALAAVVGETASRLQASRPVKIVEVGAGTGSTTSEILPVLAGTEVEYIFTDVSASFFGPARAKFKAYPFVRYATLDLEGDQEPGRLIEGADIVVAANVLHATADLLQSLDRVRRILRPGGALLILEGTTPQRFGDLTVGMTEGWWRFRDTSLRPSYPLLSRESWLTLLAEAGFEADALAEEGAFSQLTRSQTILVARSRGVRHEQAGPLMWLSAAEQKTLLADALKNSGIVPEATISIGQGRSHLDDLATWLRAHPAKAQVVVELSVESLSRLSVPEAATRAAEDVLSVLQTVLSCGELPDTLWLITFAAAALADGPPLSLTMAALLGLVRTARLEHPELRIRCVDLPASPEPQDLRQLALLLKQGTSEDFTALRSGSRRVPRLVPAQASAAKSSAVPELDGEAVYLVTGGYGGLGLRTVQWMAERGARHVVMLGRHEPATEIQSAMADLERTGVRLYAWLADVSDRGEVAALFARIEALGRRLKGIVHAAGSLDDATLLQQSGVRLRRVFAAKVAGAWYLDEASRSATLDFFVLFGSAASVLGSAGQSNHSAANSFLDALSVVRHQQGLPATTIAWGAWSDIGAAARLRAAREDAPRPSRGGFGVLSPEEGVALLGQAIAGQRANVAALRVCWEEMLAPAQPRAGWSFLAELAPVQSPTTTEPLKASSTFAAALRDCSAKDQLSVIETHLRERLGETLNLPAADLDRQQSFTELGLDSLMALQLKNELQAACGLVLPASFFFEYDTLQSAAAYLNARLEPSARAEVDVEELEELTL